MLKLCVLNSILPSSQVLLHLYLSLYFPRIFQHSHLYQVLIARAKILTHASARGSQFQHSCNPDLERLLELLVENVFQPGTSNC